MKKVFLCLLIIISVKALNAQDNYDNNNDGEDRGFKKENVFVGGSISLGFGSGNFGIGANPEIGYSFSQFLDAGVAFNLNYNSQRYYDVYSGADIGKLASFNYGAGVFVRAYPVSFLFVQLQPEENWINYNSKDFSSNVNFKNKVSAASLIGGVGYSQRIITQGSYFLMLGLDLLTNENSPYRDSYNHAVPIIRGGFDVYLHPSRKSKPVGRLL